MKLIILLLLLTTQAWGQIQIAPPFNPWEVREYGVNGQILTFTSTIGANDTIEKTAGTTNSISGQVEALAISSESSAGGDTSVEFTVDGTTDRVLVGLTAQDPPASGPVELSRTIDINPTIDFGLWTLNTSVYIVNRTSTSGLLISGLSITTGDRLKIGTVGADIKVYKNDIEFCTLGIAPCNTGNSLTINYPMKVVGYFLNVGYSASSIKFFGFGTPECGSDNGTVTAEEPTQLCTAGTPSAVTENTATWDWTCTIGTPINCQAFKNGAFQQFPTTPNPPSDAIKTKGGILTSDGNKLIEVPACADGQVLIFNSSQPSGLACGAN